MGAEIIETNDIGHLLRPGQIGHGPDTGRAESDRRLGNFFDGGGFADAVVQGQVQTHDSGENRDISVEVSEHGKEIDRAGDKVRQQEGVYVLQVGLAV